MRTDNSTQGHMCVGLVGHAVDVRDLSEIASTEVMNTIAL